MKTTTKLVLAADLAGTAVFAIEGAIAAMRGGLDLLGVMVIAFTVALGGGVVRDLLIGAAPPNAIRDWRYPALAFTMGLLTFVFHAQILAIPEPILVALDAAGLALFAVAGAQKAVEYGIGPFIAALMGAVTGVGGGVVRDLLLARVPTVLVADIYASAAFVGGVLVVAGRRAGLPPVVAAVGAGAACFALRLTAVRYGWHLLWALRKGVFGTIDKSRTWTSFLRKLYASHLRKDVRGPGNSQKSRPWEYHGSARVSRRNLATSSAMDERLSGQRSRHCLCYKCADSVHRVICHEP